MAAETRIEQTDPGKSAMDYVEHERTYALFLWLAKWTCISAAIILFLMAFFLTGSGQPPAPANTPAAPAAGQAAH